MNGYLAASQLSVECRGHQEIRSLEPSVSLLGNHLLVEAQADGHGVCAEGEYEAIPFYCALDLAIAKSISINRLVEDIVIKEQDSFVETVIFVIALSYCIDSEVGPIICKVQCAYFEEPSVTITIVITIEVPFTVNTHVHHFNKVFRHHLLAIYFTHCGGGYVGGEAEVLVMAFVALRQ